MSYNDPNSGPGYGFPPAQPAQPGFPPSPAAGYTSPPPFAIPSGGQGSVVSGYGYSGPSVVTPKRTRSSLIIIAVVALITVGIAVFNNLNHGQSMTPVKTNPSSLRVGDCIQDFQKLPSSFKTVGLISCSAPHEAEVFFIEPNSVDIDAVNAELCRTAFKDYIGVDYSQSTLTASYIVSTKDNSAIARLTCVVFDDSNPRVTTIFKDSRR